MGQIYQTESGYMKTTANGSRWPLVAANGSVIAGSSGGSLGLTDHGTRLMARFSNVQGGVQLWVEAVVTITSNQGFNGSAGNTPTGFARLAVTDANGAGAFQPAATGSSHLGGIAQVPLSGGAGTAVWEVIETDTTAFEQMEPRVVVAYISNLSVNLPNTGTASVRGGYGPASTSATAALTAPLPRFVDTSLVERTLLVISPQPTRQTYRPCGFRLVARLGFQPSATWAGSRQIRSSQPTFTLVPPILRQRW